MPKVSILVPIYNVETYLDECLESLVGQTLRDIEIICINDGSTDGSLEIVRRYASKDSRVVVIDKPNTGYGDSMNIALDRATGEFIGIVESDDWVEPNMFEHLFRVAHKNKAQIVKSEFYEFFTDGREGGRIVPKKSGLLLPHETNRVLNPRNNIHIFFQQPSIWSAIYEKRVLDENQVRFLASPGASYQDTSFSFKAFASASRVVFIKDAFLHYRQDNLLSSINDSGKVFAVAEEYAEIARFLTENVEDNAPLIRLMKATRWGAYRWNIGRLEPNLAAEFIEFASSQYKREFTEGSFAFEYCDVNFTREITELIDNPGRVTARKKAQFEATVSVIFPIYNVERTVQSSLESVLNQTLSSIEVIVVDDGSRDRSFELVEDYYRADPRIRIFSQSNAGLSDARNTGINLATAKYLAFLDSDDEFSAIALERLVKAAEATGADLVVGSSRVIFESDNSTAIQRSNTINYLRPKFKEGTYALSPTMLSSTDVHVWNKLFLREKIDELELRFPSGLLYEDSYFFNAYAWHAKSASYLSAESPIHTYYRRSGTIMDRTNLGGLHAFDHVEIVFRLLPELDTDSIRERYGTYFLKMLSSHLTLALNYSGNEYHEQIWRRTRKLFWENAETLRTLDPAMFDELNEMIFPVRWLRSLDSLPIIGKTLKNKIVSRHH